MWYGLDGWFERICTLFTSILLYLRDRPTKKVISAPRNHKCIRGRHIQLHCKINPGGSHLANEVDPQRVKRSPSPSEQRTCRRSVLGTFHMHAWLLCTSQRSLRVQESLNYWHPIFVFVRIDDVKGKKCNKRQAVIGDTGATHDLLIRMKFVKERTKALSTIIKSYNWRTRVCVMSTPCLWYS